MPRQTLSPYGLNQRAGVEPALAHLSVGDPYLASSYGLTAVSPGIVHFVDASRLVRSASRQGHLPSVERGVVAATTIDVNIRR